MKYILFLLFILSFISCSRPKVNVAIMTKLEAGSIIGTSEINAAKLFLINNPDSRISFIPYDDGWNPEIVEKIYDDIRKDNIDIILTSHTSSCAVKLIDKVNSDKVFMLVTGATTDELSGKNDYIFRSVQSVESEQRSIAEYINRMENIERIGVIRDTLNSAYTTPGIFYFRKYFEKDIAFEMEINIDKMDISAISEKLKNDYDLLYIFVGGNRASAGIIAQLSYFSRNDKPIMLTPWLHTPEIIQTAGVAIKNCIMPSHYESIADNPPVQRYINSFIEKFGYPPTYISLNVYTGLQILNECIRNGADTPDEIRKYLEKGLKISTLAGDIYFDEYGEVDMPLYFKYDIPREFKIN